MKTVCAQNQCAGCMACRDICPTHSIKIKDSIQYMNAEINQASCINCGLCQKVCQNNNPAELHSPILWYQGWADDNIRSTSSSGGFGQELMRSFIRSGGIVATCCFEKGEFSFALVSRESEVKRFVGSKYVKSNPLGIYKAVKDSLNKGKRVLFIGLPCQVSSMRNYVNDDPNLYTVDLICHGTPSIKILKKFLQEYGFNINDVREILFRYNTRFCLNTDIKEIVPPGVVDRYSIAFLNGIDYTYNCYSCHYAQQKRVGDITIGDSWGSDLTEEIKNGISLVLCQSEKGRDLLKSMHFHFVNVDLDKAIKENHQLEHPSLIPKQRDAFFNRIDNGMSFNKAVAMAYPKICIRQDAKEVLIKLGLLKMGGYNSNL